MFHNNNYYGTEVLCFYNDGRHVNLYVDID